jgi:hypothetical protein
MPHLSLRWPSRLVLAREFDLVRPERGRYGPSCQAALTRFLAACPSVPVQGADRQATSLLEVSCPSDE